MDQPPIQLDAPVFVRRWKRIAVLVVVLCVAWMAGTLIYHFNRGEKFLREKIAEADRLDPAWRWEELQAKRKPIPPNENSAEQVIRVAATKANAVFAEEPKLFGNYPDPEVQFSDEQTTALRKELAPLQAVLGEARKLSTMPNGRFAITWNVEWTVANPHISDPRVAVNMLKWDAALRSQDCDLDGALDSCRASLNAERSYGDDLLDIHTILRASGHAKALKGGLERVLAQGEPSEVALARIQEALEQVIAEPRMLHAARGERANIDKLFESYESGETSLDSLLDGLLGAKLTTGYQRIDRITARFALGSVTQRRAEVLEYNNRMVEMRKLPIERQGAEFDRLHRSTKKESMFLRTWTASESVVFDRSIRDEIGLRCALIIVALERFRRIHKRWPDSLESLVPDQLKNVPTDPFDGTPLRYRRNQDGVAVYSIWPDGQDYAGKLTYSTAKGANFGLRLWDVAKRRQLPKSAGQKSKNR